MDDRIRFGLPIEPLVPIEELPPVSLISEGNVVDSKKPFQSYILESVYEILWQHVRSSMEIECGGILVGHPFKNHDGTTTFTIIVGAIPQPSVNRGIAHFTVGPDEVAKAREELERKFPGLIAVGWYHSHPGHGIFLSAQDMTIVRSIYNLHWHLAVVLDPQRNQIGAFVGPDGVPVSNLIRLKKEPDGIRLIAKYNQLRAYQDEQKNIPQALLDGIFELVETSPELHYWKKQGKYHDLILSSPILLRQEAPVVSLNIPEPARKMRSNSNLIRSILLVFTPAVIFSALSLAAIFLLKAPPLILFTLGCGVILSILAGYGAIHLFNLNDHSRASESQNLKSANYKLLGTLLLMFVLFGWVAITILSIVILK